MCGIAGYLSWSPDRRLDLEAMVAPLRNRGPDRRGVAAARGAGLAAARLALVGGSEGDQPRASRGGRSLFVMNGEIYNWRELAASHGVETGSDTALAHELLDRFGEAALDLFRGPFALAHLDAREGRLLLARDEIGQRPLLVARLGEVLVFASSVESLLRGGLRAEADEEGLRDLATLQFLAPGRTPFRGVESLRPGTTLVVGRGARGLRERRGRLRHRLAEPAPEPTGVARAFDEALVLQAPADRPVGVFLSGGLDSSALVCGLRRIGRPAARAWVGAFAGAPALDERPWARRAAAAAGCPLEEVVIGPEAWWQALPETVRALEMPLAGPGSVAQRLLAERAASELRVVFGGQGGDEVFGGYERLRLLQILLGAEGRRDPAYAPLEAAMRRGLARGGGEGAWRASLDRSAGLAALGSGGLFELARGGFRPERFFAGSGDVLETADRFERAVTLPGLVHVDERTTAHHGLEGRHPFLDPALVRSATSRPLDLRSPAAAPRALFREALGSRMPEPLRERRDKMGFPVPLAAWFGGPLREALRALLLDRRALERGLYDAAGVEALLRDPGRHGRTLVFLAMVEWWHRHFLDRVAPAAPELAAGAGSSEARREFGR